MPIVILGSPGPVLITDGTSIAAVKPASTAALTTDPALVVALSPNSPFPLPSGASTEATLAAVKADTDAIVTSSASAAIALNVSLSTRAADATLTGGTQKAIARGGVKGATTAADVTGTAEGADHQALDVQLYHGGTAKDPTAVRALTSADIVTAAQGAAAALAAAWPVKVTDGTNTMPTLDAVGHAGFVKITDGTHTMPTGDAAARPLFVEITDGTNLLPTMDTAGRAGFHKITDGTNVATVKAASTAAVATDLALVVALSPNNAITTAPAASATATLSNVAASASSVTLLALNGSRKNAMFFNDSGAILYLKFGTTASLTSYTVQVGPNGYYELPNGAVYTGRIDGIWGSATGNLRVTELT